MSDMRKASRYVVLVVGLILSLSANADSFRCEGQIIEQGMSQDDVLQYCGQPDSTNNEVRISWTYKRQAGEMDIVIYFYANGDIEQIESQQD